MTHNPSHLCNAYICYCLVIYDFNCLSTSGISVDRINAVSSVDWP